MDKEGLIEILVNEYSVLISIDSWYYNNDLWEDDIENYVVGKSLVETLRDSSETMQEVRLWEEIINDINNGLNYEGVKVKFV